jgi:predicted NACHT family NTPase
LQGKTLEEYLLQRWLKNALEVARVTPEQENVLLELFKKERVWLLLDGVDEIAGDSYR